MLPKPVISAMDRALEDERHALATYKAIIDMFGEVRPFINIAGAEQRHIDALTSLYAQYGVKIPQNNARAAPEVDQLSIEELCQVGVEAEIENIRLYDEELLDAVSVYPDIQFVMQNLRDASAERHLPAFQRCVARGGRMGGSQGRGSGRNRRSR